MDIFALLPYIFLNKSNDIQSNMSYGSYLQYLIKFKTHLTV